VPLGVINHGAVALGLVGLFLLGRRVHGNRERAERDGYLVLLALIGANWAVYAWTTVEMRYGSVLLLALFPLAGYAVVRIAADRSVRTIAATVVGVAGYVVLALLLSGWVREQSAPIREALAQRHARVLPSTDTAEGPGRTHAGGVAAVQRRITRSSRFS
jgi:hypothetical protein